MDEQQLKKANELAEQIKTVKNTLRTWERCTQITNNVIPVITPDHSSTVYLPFSDQTYGILKALNIAHFKEVLNNLQSQFEAL